MGWVFLFVSVFSDNLKIHMVLHVVDNTVLNNSAYLKNTLSLYVTLEFKVLIIIPQLYR